MELMIVVAIIGIVSAIAVPCYAAYRNKAHDTTARADLRSAMRFLDLYCLENYEYPDGPEDLLTVGFRLSGDVSFTRFGVGSFDGGQQTVHMHIKHELSPNTWHANYPQEGYEIEIR